MVDQWPDAPGNESDYRQSELKGDAEESEAARIEAAVEQAVMWVENGTTMTEAVVAAAEDNDLQHQQARIAERVREEVDDD